ncbi:MAG TPA: M28 family metallopeptidase [Gemmatimonadales bacterium]|nr:M28 family metallopeptidase [Gemmatimonadales bacterium]
MCALRHHASLLVLCLLAGCHSHAAGPSQGQVTKARSKITAGDLLASIKALADDSMLGRAPGGPAEPKVIAYVTGEFKKLGLAPGNPDGSWTQPVDLLGFTATPSAEFTVRGRKIPLTFHKDYVALSRHPEDSVNVVNSDIVFVGYGAVAPEYGWDDFKGVDVRGKTLVMLINDPPVRDPADTTRLDSTMFRGNAMTYYGRWTYKYEIASAKGAAAAIIVHQTIPAAYGWDVVDHSNSHENMDVRQADNNKSRVQVESWITYETAKKLFQAAGQDFDALERAARTKEFHPVDLKATATFHLANKVREVRSHNILARLAGGDPKLRNQYVIYTAHWDHLGIVDPINGDSIANGAIDNASGVAGILAIAKAFTALPVKPRRSIIFMAVTAEEKGLLGARYYTENPLYPLDHTVANFNIDGVNQWGRTTDVTVVGKGASTLEDVLDSVASEDHRTLSPDPEPEKGFYYRADHFEFAKKGVPALFLDSGIHYIGKPESYSKTKRDEYTYHDYHNVTDEVKPDWDLSGAVDDLGLLFATGVRVADADGWPTWKPGNEFKARRDSMLGMRGE